MRRLGWALAAGLLAVAGCVGTAPGPSGAPEPVVAHGTGFGMCMGYCRSELTVARTGLELREGSPFPEEYPERTRSLEIAPAEWDRVRALARPEVMEEVEGVHGCPDCADGGLEWVELRLPGRAPLRVTFEFGDPPAAIAELHEALRALRERFPD